MLQKRAVAAYLVVVSSEPLIRYSMVEGRKRPTARPCGVWKSAPKACPVLWANPAMELPKDMPARVAAYIISLRASRSFPSLYALGRYVKDCRTAISPGPAVILVPHVDTYPSIAWVRASMPV